jgi:hypothetical protein
MTTVNNKIPKFVKYANKPDDREFIIQRIIDKYTEDFSYLTDVDINFGTYPDMRKIVTRKFADEYKKLTELQDSFNKGVKAKVKELTEELFNIFLSHPSAIKLIEYYQEIILLHDKITVMIENHLHDVRKNKITAAEYMKVNNITLDTMRENLYTFYTNSNAALCFQTYTKNDESSKNRLIYLKQRKDFSLKDPETLNKIYVIPPLEVNLEDVIIPAGNYATGDYITDPPYKQIGDKILIQVHLHSSYRR